MYLRSRSGSTLMFSTVGVQSSGILSGDRSISLEFLVVPLSPGGTGHLVNQFCGAGGRTCPFSGVKQTCRLHCEMSAYDPKADITQRRRLSLFHPPQLKADFGDRCLNHVAA